MVAGKSSGLVLDVRAASGGTFVDRSRFHHTITNTAVKSIKGLGDGLAGLYDGSTSYLDCGNKPILNITDAITIEAWVNPKAFETVGDGSYVVSKGNTIANTVYSLYISPTGALGIMINGGSVRGSDGTIALNNYSHIAVTVSGRSTIFYINATNAGTATLGADIVTNAKSLQIGLRSGSTYFNGTIGLVRILNRALSAGEIAKLYLSKAALLRL